MVDSGITRILEERGLSATLVHFKSPSCWSLLEAGKLSLGWSGNLFHTSVLTVAF